jgi:hypothetical protein
VIARFRIVDARGAFRAHWSYTSPDYDFFQHFLGSEGVREALPELQIPARLGQDLGFEESPEGTLILDGQIAATLVHGGAYLRFEGTAQQAKELGRAFVDALIGDRHTGFKVWRSYEAWTPWFFEISWDYSWVLLDVEHAEVTLLCVTDTD